MPRKASQSMALRLYVAGDAPSSVAARRTLDTLLEHPEFVGRVRREVIDALREPRKAKDAGLTATPTLLVSSGGRLVRFIGDFTSPDPLIEFLRGELSSSPPQKLIELD